jgi:tetratricopeptide (TPR) repeat protein
LQLTSRFAHPVVFFFKMLDNVSGSEEVCRRLVMTRRMGRWAIVVVVVCTSVGFHGRASAQADRHDPFSRDYADFSRGYSQDQFRRAFPQNGSNDSARGSFGGGSRGAAGVFVVVSPFGYGPFLYNPYAYYPYSLGTPLGEFGPYVAPPVFVTGEAQFGPRAVQRFMGVDSAPAPAMQPIARPRRGADADDAPLAPASDARARLKAWRLIDKGDVEFVANRFAQALSRYRESAAAARDLAEAHFRQGFALIAMGRYADAAKAFQQGLTLDPDWADSEFRLDDLYGVNKAAKGEHLDALRKAVAAHPHDADLLFLMGVYLYFDGQTNAAAPLLRRAANVLGQLGADHLTGFLKRLPSEKKAAENNAAGAKPGDVNPPLNNRAADPAAPRLPPPPLPAEDKPAGGKPREKPAETPIDPFDALGR